MDRPPQADDFEPGDQSRFYGESDYETPMSRNGAPQGIGESVRQSRASSARTARAQYASGHTPPPGSSSAGMSGPGSPAERHDGAIMRDPNTNQEIFEESGPELPFLQPQADEPARPEMTPHPTVSGATKRHDRYNPQPQGDRQGPPEGGVRMNGNSSPSARPSDPGYDDPHYDYESARAYDSAGTTRRPAPQESPRTSSQRNVFDLRDEPHTESSYGRRGETSQVDYEHGGYPTNTPQATQRHYREDQRTHEPAYAAPGSERGRGHQDYPETANPRSRYAAAMDSQSSRGHYTDTTTRRQDDDFDNRHHRHGAGVDPDAPYDSDFATQSHYPAPDDQLPPAHDPHYAAYPDETLADVDVDVPLTRNSSPGRNSGPTQGRLPRPEHRAQRPRLKGRSEPVDHNETHSADEPASAEPSYDTSEQPTYLAPEPVDPVVRVAELKLQDRQNLATQAIYRLIVAGTVAIAAFLIGLFLIMTNLLWPGAVFAVLGALVFMWELTSHGRMKTRRRPQSDSDAG